MVLLAKCLLLLFMIIVVHGNIVVDVEQKVNIDGCCNGCCPCNSCGCWNPKTKKMVYPGTKVDFGGCLRKICRNKTWVPDPEEILGYNCDKGSVGGDPHFVTFSGAEYDWNIPCNHALAQLGDLDEPTFGVFMKFNDMGLWAEIGPTIYEQFGTQVGVDPADTSIVTMPPGGAPILISTFTFLGSGIWAWPDSAMSGCIWISGTSHITIKLCAWDINIWAPRSGQSVWPFWPSGYPTLDGLCGRNNYMMKLYDRSGNDYPNPGRFTVCPNDFGKSWQTTTWGNSKYPGCPEPVRRRKKRDTADPQTVCRNFTNSPYNDECLKINQETGPAFDRLYKTCMFDLCMVDRFTDPEIMNMTQMREGIKQIAQGAKNQEDITIGCYQDGTCKDVYGECVLIFVAKDRDGCDPTLCSGEFCTCCPLP